MQVTGEPAQELGVQAGWVIFSVAGEAAPQDTAQVTKLVMRAFKDKKDDVAGLVDFKFRVPIVDGFVHCIQVGGRGCPSVWRVLQHPQSVSKHPYATHRICCDNVPMRAASLCQIRICSLDA